MSRNPRRYLEELTITVILSILTSIVGRICKLFTRASDKYTCLKSLPERINSAILHRAHAHNDYRHQFPLYDALERGYNSVEADVFEFRNELYVGHYPWEIRSGRTLTTLYLEPLRRVVEANGGMVHDIDKPFFLLIDIKLWPNLTYDVLKEILNPYQHMLTRFSHNKVEPGAVSIILTGNRPIQVMNDEAERYAAVDGRLEDLHLNLPHSLMPWVSDRWTRHFKWRGDGIIPPQEHAKLKQVVEQAQRHNKQLRFWATPHKQALWQYLLENGVDIINTDDLDELHRFLTKQYPLSI